ncbi:MFS transporter [Xylanimonas sp. McL0601]|uniref:MFS transporter n=1 Tax=Xylanimonas sp. McL0601 TaxID=3414739 RepID=UPI003CEA0FC5
MTTPRLPWPSLLVLAAATFVMVTAEMLPTAVLPQLSAGLGVSEARTGALVSVWAGTVVVASFPLVRATRRVGRRRLVVAALLALAASGALTAVAPGYPVALAARVAGAAAVGVLWATVNAHLADLVPDVLLGRAVSVVLGGATLGMVLGTPLANLVARGIGWRAAFAALAVLALASAALVRLVVADAPAPGRSGRTLGDGPGGTLATPSRWPMAALTVTVGVLLVGHYGAYTFVTRLVDAPAGALPGGSSTVLLLFGLASAAGLVAAGRFGARTGGALVVSSGLTAVGLLALPAAATQPVLGLGVVLLWGAASGALPPLAQTAILRLGGPAHRTTAGALIPVVFNGGIAVGAALAAALVSGHGVGALPLPAAVVVLVATTATGAVVRGTSRRQAQAAPPDALSSADARQDLSTPPAELSSGARPAGPSR